MLPGQAIHHAAIYVLVTGFLVVMLPGPAFHQAAIHVLVTRFLVLMLPGPAIHQAAIHVLVSEFQVYIYHLTPLLKSCPAINRYVELGRSSYCYSCLPLRVPGLHIS